MNPGEAAAARYFDEVQQWGLENQVRVLWFSSAEENWKQSASGKEYESRFGILNTDLNVKAAYLDTDFFRSVAVHVHSANLTLGEKIDINFYSNSI